MSGRVFDGKPEAIALTVPLAEADADAVAREVEDADAEAELEGGAVLCPDPVVGPLQAAMASAAEASAVAPASRRILWVVSAIEIPCTFLGPIEVPPSLVGPADPARLRWTRGDAGCASAG